ncbi:MAG TPA: hypothetical protein VHA78_05640 [Candidatus Peribacteraceae bacterium]|nr:hypothetical protein [Candidatus Peribacteraceae bacterium]
MNKHTAAAAYMQAPPDARWIYDEFMKHIEPDLMTDHIEHVDEKYAGETAEERAERYEQYTMAFLIFDECLKDFDATMSAGVQFWKKKMEEFAKRESDTEDAAHMKIIEESIDSSAQDA